MPWRVNRMISRFPAARRLAPLGLVLIVVACTNADDPGVVDEVGAEQPAASDGSTDTSVQDSDTTASSTGTSDLTPLPVRAGPRRETTGNVPHVQIDAASVPEIDAELRRRVYSLPGVEERESLLSLPGARSLWLADDLDLARPDVLPAGRELAHIHPDGSLHVWLPVDRANEVDEAKWGELHPWVDRDDFWDGVVMVYTPETFDELDVTMRIIIDAYNYVTGDTLDPEAFS